MQIVKICEKICDSRLIKLTPNYAYGIVELVDSMYDYREGVIKTLLGYYRQILDYIIFVFEGFESCIMAVNRNGFVAVYFVLNRFF